MTGLGRLAGRFLRGGPSGSRPWRWLFGSAALVAAAGLLLAGLAPTWAAAGAGQPTQVATGVQRWLGPAVAIASGPATPARVVISNRDGTRSVQHLVRRGPYVDHPFTIIAVPPDPSLDCRIRTVPADPGFDFKIRIVMPPSTVAGTGAADRH